MNVKEELMDDGMDESEIDSFCTEQSELTTENETEEEFNDRLQQAKERTLARRSHIKISGIVSIQFHIIIQFQHVVMFETVSTFEISTF